MPILLVQKPAAVRSRKLLKNATPCENSGLRPLRPGDVVEHRGLLGGRAGDEPLVEALLALAIEPRQTAAHGRLPRRLVADDEVHELGHAGIGGAAGAFVARDDEIDEHAHGLVLVRGEELRLERRRRRWPPAAPRWRAETLRSASASVQANPAASGAEASSRSASRRSHQSSPFRRASAMYSPVRIASARIVQVGFLSACETNGPPSATNRFLTSCAWQFLLSTDDLRRVAHARDAELVNDAPAGLDAVARLLASASASSACRPSP